MRDGPPTLAERRRDLHKLKGAILAHEEDFVSALNADFGHRSREETLMLDVGSTAAAIHYLLQNLLSLIRPEPRGVAMIFQPSTNRVVYQPPGLVGVVSPWNYPVGLALIPLATALATGNRVMLKPSELVPATSELLLSVLAEAFQEDQVAVVTGDAKVGRAFKPPLRLHPLYRKHPGRARGHARSQREPGPGHARARRQVARHR